MISMQCHYELRQGTDMPIIDKSQRTRDRLVDTHMLSVRHGAQN